MANNCCRRDVQPYPILLLDLDSICMYILGLKYSLKNRFLDPSRDDSLFLSSSSCPATAESKDTF